MNEIMYKIIDSIEPISDKGIDLINKVDSFYNSAWNKLIIIGTVSFAVIGIIVPYIIQWYQKKTLKISEELLIKEMEGQSLKLKNEILEDINKTLEKKLNDFETTITKFNASLTAKAFHLQGNSQISDNLFSSALSDFVIAAENYLLCEEYSNLQTILNVILENCLPKLSQNELEDLKISDNCDLDNLIKKLSENDEKGMLKNIIREIRIVIKKMPKEKK